MERASRQKAALPAISSISMGSIEAFKYCAALLLENSMHVSSIDLADVFNHAVFGHHSNL
jgi:hypothetical protein